MNLRNPHPKIIVVGSCSIDLVLNTEEFPGTGETVLATRSENFFGGKGANQAVAAARLGATAYFVGAVGMDPKGQQVLRHLVEEGVNVGFVAEKESVPTGAAYVAAAGGQNTIIVVPSANHQVRPEQIDFAEKHFASCDMVLLQLEIPIAVAEKAAASALYHGKKLGIYASPGIALPQQMIDAATFIVVKQKDVPKVFGMETEEALRRYPNKIFIREDALTIKYSDGLEVQREDGERPDPVHAMGAGDAFTAGLGVALCHGSSVANGVKFGLAVASRAAAKRGSQAGLPFLKELKNADGIWKN